MRSSAAMSVAIFLGACGSGTSRDATEMVSSIAEPSAHEGWLLGHARSEVSGERMCVDGVTASPQKPQLPLDGLSFGDGKLAWPGDPGHDQAVEEWNAAVPLAHQRLRLPTADVPRDETSRCDWRLTFYPPYFGNRLAFVVADERSTGRQVAGGAYHIWIFHKLEGRWMPLAYGHSTYGRPVI